MLYSYACSYKARDEARVEGDAEYIPNKLQFRSDQRRRDDTEHSVLHVDLESYMYVDLEAACAVQATTF